MKILHPRCAGSDVHKTSITACIRLRKAGTSEVLTKVFGTFTADLERLRDWLGEHRVLEVAMESTGVYWIRVLTYLSVAPGARSG